jgi:hypothetical protein
MNNLFTYWFSRLLVVYCQPTKGKRLTIGYVIKLSDNLPGCTLELFHNLLQFDDYAVYCLTISFQLFAKDVFSE